MQFEIKFWENWPLTLDNSKYHSFNARKFEVYSPDVFYLYYILSVFPTNPTSKLQPLDQGIIKNYKIFYRQEVVKNVLECIESEQTPNISVLTAMIFVVDKAWKKVAPSTILKIGIYHRNSRNRKRPVEY